ncbi:MAG: hypothetical protein ACK478_02395, partial [Flavobacteriales bacterium]
MLKKLLIIVSVALSINSAGQTISNRPIYNSLYQSLTVLEMSGGGIYFGCQNPKYQYITDIESFVVANQSEAIELMKEVIKILELPRTARDQHIQHEYAGVSIIRLGIAQKRVYIEELSLNKAIA